MITPRYLLAKFIPDLLRKEPKNIGVILWTPFGVSARFIGEYFDRPGIVDGRSVPNWVTSKAAYKQWISYWNKQISQPVAHHIKSGIPVSRSSYEFLDILKASSRGNFILEDGGVILDPIDEGGQTPLLDHLFNALVQKEQVPKAVEYTSPSGPTLESVCERVFQEVNAYRDPNFKTCLKVPVAITNKLIEEYEFSYAYQNGSLKRLYQRFPFPRNDSKLDKLLYESAWKFDKVTSANVIEPSHCGVLVYLAKEELEDKKVTRCINLLSSVAKVFNLHEDKDVSTVETDLKELVSTHT